MTDDTLCLADTLKRGFSANLVEHPEEYPFDTLLFVYRYDGSTAEATYASGSEDDLVNWAYETVTSNLGIGATLCRCNWMPGRFDPNADLDYEGFDRFLANGCDPADWPGSVEVITAAVIRPDERPWLIIGYLCRESTEGRIDWLPGVASPEIRVLQAISHGVQDVRAALDVVREVTPGVLV